MGMALVSIVTVGLLSLTFTLKRKITKMNDEEWTKYLQSISRKNMTARLYVFFIIGLVVIGAGVHWAFGVIGFEKPMQMTILFGVFTILYAVIDFAKNESVIRQKLSMLKK